MKAEGVLFAGYTDEFHESEFHEFELHHRNFAISTARRQQSDIARSRAATGFPCGRAAGVALHVDISHVNAGRINCNPPKIAHANTCRTS
jgi:hypothetical protein